MPTQPKPTPGTSTVANDRPHPHNHAHSCFTRTPVSMNVTWQSAVDGLGIAETLGTSGAWGSCMNMSDDGEYRYAISNSLPDFYMNPYCPLGVGYGYCIGDEDCIFDGMYCGGESVGDSLGYTPYGDVWYPMLSYYKVPMVGNPTRSDRPGSMYDAVDEGEKNIGAAVGFTIQNGVSIQGPNDAGDYNIDEAGFILPCGGHVTPPTDATILDQPDGTPPLYHFHKAPDCLDAFVTNDKPYSHNSTADQHGLLFAYSLDGFGIYTYTDLAGAAPVLDECGGHFGPTADDDDAVVYHYHASTATPYHLACQGPALGKCSDTQHGVDFCGVGCGAEVCAQPGTSVDELASYVAEWNTTWLESYTNNIADASPRRDL
mmetsp:Transcript_35318/g.94621  ORF Transcript_35318/g.94621 Transcript_35318/m.94621 type:complete len:373 (+) Transcript_35318:324-1442(+)